MRRDCAFPIRFVDSGGLRIAYQVVGDGPIDLLYVPGYISNLELAWEDSGYRRLLEGLSSFARLIVMDKRGSGLSERGINSQSVEDHVADIGAVLDAAGSERVAILGTHEGGAAALLFAAARPERVTSVIAYSTRARCLASDDYPIGWPPEIVNGWVASTTDEWGRIDYDPAEVAAVFGPSHANDSLLVWDLGRFVRLSSTPRETASVLRMYVDLDIRAVLPAIRVPVLVLGRKDEVLNPWPNSQYLADRLPNAQLQALDGDELVVWWGDVDAVARAVRVFLTGIGEPAVADRILATVMFTDVVGSTEQNVAVGDRRWKETLDRHDDHVRDVVARFDGRVVKTTGDGVLATFDGPARAVRCGDYIRESVSSLGLQVRTGIHTGEVEVRGDDIAGVAVTLAQRIMSTASGSEVLVSRTVKDLIAGSAIELADRGTHQLKGLPEDWQLYAVERA